MGIKIRKSSMADTRTCDFTKVDEQTLRRNSLMHIQDVSAGMDFFTIMMEHSAREHDADKLRDIKEFHRDFSSGFATRSWLDKHWKISRHHLNEPDGVPEDVNLIDVIEMIVDCTMAGLARKGEVYPPSISPEVLMKAFHNTATLLVQNVEVEKETV